jgi:hypothetical protein
MLRTTIVFVVSAVLVLLNLHTLARYQSFATDIGHPLSVTTQSVFVAIVLVAAAAFGVSAARRTPLPEQRPQDLVIYI